MTEREEFWRLVNERLDAGSRTYADRSFDRSPADLVGEIEQEILDICGWAFVLWCRIRRRLRSAGDQR